MTKHVLNMFISIKNGQKSKKNTIKLYRKGICENFLKLLWDEGFINGYRIIYCKKAKIEIFLKYSSKGDPAINSIKFISKPGRKVYCSIKQIWKLDSNKTFVIFSTIDGLMSIKDCKKKRLGGEPLVVLN